MNNWLKFKVIPDESGTLISNNRRYKVVNEEIELLHKKIEAQDKIINTQALEIARLKKEKAKAREYIKHSQSYGTMAQVMPHLKPYVNGDDLLEILGDKENEI